MKKLMPILLTLLLLFSAFTVFASAEEKTMSTFYKEWEENGYPSDVAYAFLAGQTSPSSESEDQRMHESWEIGIVGTSSETAALLQESVPDNCELTFIDCTYSRAQMQAAYDELSAFGINLSVTFIPSLLQNTDRVELVVADAVFDTYLASMEEKYGDLVKVVKESEAGIYDAALYAADVAVADAGVDDTVVAFADETRIANDEDGAPILGGAESDNETIPALATSGTGTAEKTESNTTLKVIIAVAVVLVCSIAVVAVVTVRKKKLGV